MDAHDNLVTTEELAARIGVDPATIRNYVKRGVLRADVEKSGSHYWFTPEHVDEFCASVIKTSYDGKEKMYTTREAAKYLHVAQTTIQSYATKGLLKADIELPATSAGRKSMRKYKESTLIAFQKWYFSRKEEYP